MNVLVALLGCVCVLGFVMVVGHAMWLVARAVFTGHVEPPPPSRERTESCPACRDRVPRSRRFCPGCDLDLDSELASRITRLRRAQREVSRLVETEELDAETAERVAAGFEHRIRAMREPVPVPRATPVSPIVDLPIHPSAEPLDLPQEEPAPLDLPSEEREPPSPLEPPDAPSRRHGVLAAFLEEKNILWGELVGGLLIVGCSIALVLTLWRDLRDLPYSSFLLASAITAALYGAGQYTLHHWRLSTTSRGLLVIALLLAPLNLLLLADPGSDSSSTALDIAIRIIAVAAFTAMARNSGRDLIHAERLPGPVDRRWLLALAVVGAPATQTLPAGAEAARWLPLACDLVASFAVILGVKRRNAGEEATVPMLLFVGLGFYALLGSWGWQLTRAVDRLAALHDFSLLVAIAGLPLLEAGLLAQRRTAGAAVWRVAGTAVSLVGGLMLAAGGGLAWPVPSEMMIVAIIAGIAFTRAAWVERLPWFQAVAFPAFAFAVVLGAHGLAGHWSEDLPSLLGTSLTGLVLAGFAGVLALSAEAIARIGNRDQALAHARGGLAIATLAAGVVTFSRDGSVWPAAVVHGVFGLGLLLSDVRWRTRGLADAGVLTLIVGTLWTLESVAAGDREWWGIVLSLEALAWAGAAFMAGRRVQLYRLAAAHGAVAAALATVVFTLASPDFRTGPQNSVSLLLLAPVLLLLSRVFLHEWPTWLAPAAVFFGCVHLLIVTSAVEATQTVLLISLLGTSTLALAGSFAFHGRRRLVRLYREPLWNSARIGTVFAIPFLLPFIEGTKYGYAGAATWLAVLWFVMAWTRRETLAFAGGQLALVAATTLAALGWCDEQPWSQTGDPRFFQTVAFALAVLATLSAFARRIAFRSERLKEIWLVESLSVDRLLLGTLVIGLLLLLAFATLPFVSEELNPVGMMISAPPARLAEAFGAGTWLALGMTAIALLAELRLAQARDRVGDALVTGLLLVGFGMAFTAAGAFAADIAVASGLRWSLGLAFLIGSVLVALRRRLGHAARSLGVEVQTTAYLPITLLGSLAAAAFIVILLTTNVAELGLSGLTPSGPRVGTLFAELGWTWSLIVPLVFVWSALTLTASRERSSGYGFAAGCVFSSTIAGGYALTVVVAGGPLDDVVQMRIAMLLAAGIATWSAIWIGVERHVPGKVMLGVQTVLGLVAFALIAIMPLVRLIADPSRSLPSHYAEFAGWGWPILALAIATAYHRLKPARQHVAGYAAICGGVLLACSTQPLHEVWAGIPFHLMTAVWAVAGLGFTAAAFRPASPAAGEWLFAFAALLAIATLLGPVPESVPWLIPMLAGGYVLASAVIARRNGGTGQSQWAALLASMGLLALPVLRFAFFDSLHQPSVAERLAGPCSVLLFAAAGGWLATRAAPSAVAVLQVSTILFAGIGCVLAGWAIPNPDSGAVWLQRNGWAFVSLVAAVAGCLTLQGQTLRRASIWLGSAALGLLLIVLVQQARVFDPVTRRTPLPLPEVLAILAGIAAFMVFALRSALNPANDPFALPERLRTRHVYLAEVLLVLLFVHVRLNLPELFPPQAGRYWTFIVMIFAFIGIGSAELFERRHLWVLAKPLRQTGVLLPLIPLLAFWAKPPGVLLGWADSNAPGTRPFLGYLEKLPQHFDNYASLWFLAGFLYGLMALSRKSFGWALIAALATNAGLWALLAHNDIAAAVHPQVWVIPFALIILVSEHIHRRSLNARASAGLRWLGIGMIYLASTADMFIAGVGESLWLPVVLAVFCVAGIFAGILLRVQAFLLLGTGFLLLDLFAMIWHAAVDRSQTWVWYVSGIVLGAAILALFALFEKRRNEVLGIVDRIRNWD